MNDCVPGETHMGVVSFLILLLALRNSNLYEECCCCRLR